ncbi:hypothetical protein [Paenibacillus polysaccharolyticus]|uniref:hypothetical protein n=1 Tax=Paenibacillus polysaccharolyticus TaxID=582692 RepID=UPI00280AF76C|nr:hypothetical protein [Paenibacillus polysaccharolyticus]
MTVNEILGISLYNKQKISQGEYEVINWLLASEYRYDCYCTECGRDSVFSKVNDPAPKSIGSTTDLGLKPVDTLPYREIKFKSVILCCTRQENHKMAFFFSLYKHSSYIDIIKIGQTPSHADLLNADTKKYNKVLGGKDSHELSKAIGLFSHGVGIGSFVYLRRIFENLIEKAHQQATQTTGWDEEEYLRARMHDKVGKLANYLPQFLVENRQIYSILSKGIHELSEDECLGAFDAVRVAIELILDEEIAKKESEKKRQQATQSLASLHQGFK